MRGGINSIAADYLRRIGKAYEGHPLVMKIIAGEIASEFQGNVEAYWQVYHQEFTAIEQSRGNQTLARKVKSRVKKSLQRLNHDFPLAYQLLCRSSVYRLPVPPSFYEAMLSDPPQPPFKRGEMEAALEMLKTRALIITEGISGTDSYRLRQHNLIRSTAYNLLQERELAHQIAKDQWLHSQTHPPTPSPTGEGREKECSNLAKVQGYLEAFHHCCELQDYETAGEIMMTKVEGEDLYEKLGIWGYYRQQIEIYNRLLGNLNHWQGTCLTGLGIAYYSLGEYAKAIDFHEQSLKIKREIGDRSGEGISLGNLGIAYYSLGEYAKALKYTQEALEIIGKIGARYYEAHYLNNLAEIQQKLGNLDLAMRYCDQALNLATELGIPLVKDCEDLKQELLDKDIAPGVSLADELIQEKSSLYC